MTPSCTAGRIIGAVAVGRPAAGGEARVSSDVRRSVQRRVSQEFRPRLQIHLLMAYGARSLLDSDRWPVRGGGHRSTLSDRGVSIGGRAGATAGIGGGRTAASGARG